MVGLELISLAVCIFNGYVAKRAFDVGLQFWGWANLVFSAANIAVFINNVS